MTLKDLFEITSYKSKVVIRVFDMSTIINPKYEDIEIKQDNVDRYNEIFTVDTIIPKDDEMLISGTVEDYTDEETGIDRKVTRSEFMDEYNKALNEMFASDTDDNDIYGKDVTVHWNGIYCSVGDGATAYNTVIAAISDAMDELDDED